MRVLAADIGGTKTLVQLSTTGGEVLCEQRYPSASYPRFEELLSRFLEECGTMPDAACLAVAGPVHDHGDGQTARVTNLPWQLDSRRLAGDFRIPQVRLVNDFAAVAHGISTLREDELCPLQAGLAQAAGPRLVVGAGTGLGAAQLITAGDEWRVLPAEAGHADFAPASPLQAELASGVRARLGRCAIEDVLSGPGLVNIYRFVLERAGQPLTDERRAWIENRDAGAVSAAAAGGDPQAAEALALFCAVYGATVGNLALFSLPTGGIYVAGGIAPRLIEQLRHGPFLEAFHAKGKMRHLMATFPLAVVMNPAVGLQGARYCAIKLLKTSG